MANPYLTLEGASGLVVELIKWLKEDKPDNIYYKYFLAHKGLYPGILKRIERKFPDLSIWFEKAKYIQEAKICHYATNNKINANFAIFMLKNQHDYKDKSEQIKKIDITNRFEGMEESDVKRAISDLLVSNKLYTKE